MNKPKILLTAIFKGDSEYDLAKRMLESFMPYCAGVVVAVTKEGKSPKLAKLIKKYNGYLILTTPDTYPDIYDEEERFANFAAARNVVFDFADCLDGYDWYTWADVDDILVSGDELTKVAENALKGKFDAVFMTYWYAVRVKNDGTFNEDNVEIEHLRERLLKPKVFKWVSRLHEIALPKDDQYKPRVTEYPYSDKDNHLLAWAHITSSERVEGNIERNTRILQIQAKEEEYKDPRTLFYLAKTLYDLKDSTKDEEMLSLLDKYLELSGWAEERASAWQYKGQVYARKGDHRKALECFQKAIEQYPIGHMNYLYIAREYKELGLREESSFWLNLVLKMDAPKVRTTIGNPLEVKFMAASMKYNEAVETQKIDDAIYWLGIRNKLAGIDDDAMMDALQEMKLMNNAAKDVFNYSKWLKDNGHKDKIAPLLESLPFELGREPFAAYLANEVNEPKVWGKNTIVYYASWGVEHFEKWSAKSTAKGIGGSETAVIELTKRWAKMGYEVWVYGDPREDEGTHEGVHYRPWYEFNWNDTFNTLILWRSPHLLDRDIKAKNLFMDLHDVASQLDWTEKRMERIDKVFLKSQFHRSMLPKLPDNKAVVISNGITI